MMTLRSFGSFAPSPLEGEGRGGGSISDEHNHPLPQSLPSRGREAQEPMAHCIIDAMRSACPC